MPRSESDTAYLIFLWLPESRVWQEIGTVRTDSREQALETALALPDCPAASERPALAAVAERMWRPFIASPPPPPDGHEWKPFVPGGSIDLSSVVGPNGLMPGNTQGGEG